jgi:hypothetical protein
MTNFKDLLSTFLQFGIGASRPIVAEAFISSTSFTKESQPFVASQGPNGNRMHHLATGILCTLMMFVILTSEGFLWLCEARR